MNALQTRTPSQQDDLHVAFEALLPAIESQLRWEFRRYTPEAAGEGVQEGIAHCFQQYLRLRQKGREVNFPVALARFAARQVRAGRRVGRSLNGRDPLSRYAQRRHGITVERLDAPRFHNGEWVEAAVADRKTPIPDRVALRIDVPAWWRGLSRRMRRIAKDLAMGFTTGEVAQKYGVTAARVSQMRRELYQSWERFHWSEPSAVTEK